MATKLDDPQWRRERARKARAAQDTPDYHIDRIRQIADTIKLSDEQLARIAVLLRPDRP
jgi:hypothetical protein